MLRFRILSMLVVCVFLLALSAQAQTGSGRGSLAGSVADAAGGVLPGARVTLEPSGQSVVTDEQGEYLITNLPTGSYTLKVDAIGFQPFNQPVTIAPGVMAHQNSVLKIASNVEKVEVYAGREKGEVAAMNLQMSADNILEVLPTEVITSIPNVNIADAVGRLPGVTLERDEGEGKYVQIRSTEPRLSNLTVDGVNIPSPESSVRNIKLDTIPAALVGSINVSKTLLPSMDGDGIGGTVDLITRVATDKPFYSVSVMGGHTPIISDGASYIDQFTGAIGQRFGATKRFGVFVGGTYDYNGRGIDDVEPAMGLYQFGSNTYALFNTADYREYYYDRRRFGGAGTIDYQFSPGSVLYIRGLFSEFQDYGGKWIYTPTVNNFVTPTYSDNTSNYNFTDSPRNPNYQIANLSASYNKAAGPWFINATGAFSRSRADNEDFPSAGFNWAGVVGGNGYQQGLALSLDQSNPYRPHFNVLYYNTPGDNIYDPSQYILSNLTLTHDHSAQVNLQGSFDITRTYNWNGHMGSWQTGAKMRYAHKFDDVLDNTYNYGGTASMADFPDPYQTPNYYNGSFPYYTQGHVTNWGSILKYYGNNTSLFEDDYLSCPVIPPTQQYPCKYKSKNYVFDIHESIPAQYFMNTIDFGRWRIVAGLRLEETISNFNYVDNLDPTNTLGKISSSYVDVLPNFQVRYSFNNNTNIRAIYGRGVARPNYGNLVPTFTLNGTSRQVSQGNPYLLSTKSNNFDLLVEHYFSTVGVIQGGFFFKQISDPIVTTTYILTSGPYEGYVAAEPINLPTAYIGGFEFNLEQHFKRLPGAFSGLGIFANYGNSFSQAKYTWVDGNGIQQSQDRALPRQSPNTFNINPTYDYKNLTVRLGISFNQANIYAYNWAGTPGDTTLTGPKGPFGDNYFYNHLQYDAQIGYLLPWGLKFTAAGLDLNNEVFGFYQGSSQYPIQREYYHPTYSMSLTWTSDSERHKH